MRKKFGGILLSIFILFACFVTSACGDKYGDLEFKIMYSYAADSSEWFDASEGVFLNYMTEQDKQDLTDKGIDFSEENLLDMENNRSTIYIKVQVLNVKEKHVDKITINATSASELNFKSKTVSVNEVVPIEMSGNVKSTLSFYENNSRKSTSTELNVSRVVTGLNVNNEIKPAFKAGNSINLKNINNLIYMPIDKTNQTGVSYSLDSIGYYTNTYNYVPSITTNIGNYLNLDENYNLSAKSDLNNVISSTAYIARIKAVSLFNENIFNYFDVYIEKSGDYEPVVKFNNGKEINAESGNKIVLAKNTTNTYSQTKVHVDISESGACYLTNKYTVDSIVKYETEIYVDGIRYVIGENALGINGIIIDAGENAGEYIISLGAEILQPSSTLVFRSVVNGLNFDLSSQNVYKNYYEKIITVEKQILPTKISINGTLYEDGTAGNNTVYSVNSSSYDGLELEIAGMPTNNSANVIFSLVGTGVAENLIIKDALNNNVDLNNIKNNSKIYIKFKAGSVNQQTITLRTRSNPTWFNGEDVAVAEYAHVSVDYILVKSVTASKIELFIDQNCTIPASRTSTSITETNLIVDSVNGTNLYAKVYYEGNLDTESVKFTSTNAGVTFAGEEEKTLTGLAYTNFNGGAIYTVPLGSNALDELSTISCVAANGFVGTNSTAMALTRKTLNQTEVEALDVEGINSKVITRSDDKNYFLISKNEYAEFGIVNAENKSDGVYDINVNKDVNYSVVHKSSKSTFSVTGSTSDKLQTLDIDVYYYGLKDGYIQKLSKPIIAHAYIYSAINLFDVGALSNNSLVYVNSYFKESATTEFSYSAYAANYMQPTSSLTFNPDPTTSDDNIDVDDVNVAKLAIGEDLVLLIHQGYLEITHFNKDGVSTKITSKTTLVDLNGTIQVKLNNDIGTRDSIALTINAYRFNEQNASVVKNIYIPVKEFEKASNISVEGENIIALADKNLELRLSFMDIEANKEASTDFLATLEYATAESGLIRFDAVNNTNMTYLVYEYSLDNNGSPIKDAYGNYIIVQQPSNRLNVNFNNGRVTVAANKNYGGGLFKLVIASKDSYYSNGQETGFSNTFEINVRVSDGSLKHKFVIETAQDLQNINKNLDKNFVLGANIVYSGEVIGYSATGIKSFEGSLSGKFESVGTINYYTISLTISSYTSSESHGDIFALFSSIGENGVVSDLNIEIDFNKSLIATNVKGMNIAGLTGVNNGKISNVKVVIDSPVQTSITSASNVNFGLIAAKNYGEININNAAVELNNLLTLNLQSNYEHNIGSVVGENNGSIVGSYAGKSSLSSINFDVITNLKVSSVYQPSVYVGAVAGNNKSIVSNFLVAGKILLVGTDLTGVAAGVVGVNADQIDTVATLGLDVTTVIEGVTVAGIAGSSSGNITNAKVISAKTDTRVGITYGELKGVNVVGIASVTDGKISNCTIESFVNTKETNEIVYTLNATNNAYGIINGSCDEVELCFVKANIKATSAHLFGTQNCNVSYFVGSVAATDIISTNLSYAIVFNLNTNNEVTSAKYSVNGSAFADVSLSDNTYFTTVQLSDSDAKVANFENEYIYNAADNARAAEYLEGNTYYVKELNTTAWLSFVQALVPTVDWNNNTTNWRIGETYNTIKYNGINLYFPYFVGADLKPIMIEQPTDIQVDLNSNYNIAVETIILKPFTLVGKNVIEAMVVNYYYAQNKQEAELNVVNTHQLYTTYNNDKTVKEQGLINLASFPESAQGGIKFELLGNKRSCATISNDGKITFLNITGSEPIIVRAYSIFNPDVEAYAIFYTQYLLSDLVLSSNNISKNYDSYIGLLYTGQTEQLVRLSAENIFKNNYYNTIFNVDGIVGSLKLVAEYDDTLLSLDTTSITDIKLAIAEDAIFANRSVADVKFKLYLKSDYFANADLDDKLLCEEDLSVTLYKSATSIEMTGDSAYKVASNETLILKANLYTGFVNDTDYNNFVETSVVLDGNTFVIYNVNDRDKIKISFESLGGEYLETYLNRLRDLGLISENKNIAEIFKTPIIKTTSIYDLIETDKWVGYKYEIILELRDEFNIRALTSSIDFNVVVTADSDPKCTAKTEVNFNPTNVSTVRVENYAVTSISPVTNYKNIVTNNDVETSIIDPNSKGSVMLIYIEPEYANINEITLTTSTASVVINNVEKEVGLSFTQLVYNQTTRCYETLLDSEAGTQQGNVLKLRPYSLRDGLENIYNGVIYVHVQLEKFGGKEVDFTATLNVKTGTNEEITFVKYLSTSYLPVVNLTYNGTTNIVDGETENLVQEDSYNNVATLELYGYQFNANPTVSFEWEIEEGSEFEYDEGTKAIIKHTSTGALYNIYNYVQGDIKNDYSEVVYNQTTNSYSMDILFYVAKGIPAPFKMIANLVLLDKYGMPVTDSAELVFNPTDYILKDVYLSNISSNKNLVIGTTTKLEFGFETENSINDLSDKLYTQLLETAGTDYGKIAKLFYYYENGVKTNFVLGVENAHKAFNINIVNDRTITISGKSQFNSTIYLDIYYKYERQNDGTYDMQFSFADEARYVDFAFTLNIVNATTEENAYPIYEASDMFDSNGNCILAENSFNILMNDIVLENIKPINLNIASLDGNNKIITIKSFAVDIEETNYGLFANLSTYTDVDGVSHPTILKNVVVDYSQFTDAGLQLTNNELTNIVFGGLVANNKNGLIYNCDVLNNSVLSSGIVEILLDDSSNASLVLGGLVGINSGVITNSRVGRENFTKITANASVESVDNYQTGKLTFVIGNNKNLTNKFNVTAGAFVGENSGTISNSYVKNTSLINYSTSEQENSTAGFVAVNNSTGSINYSFVEAGEGKTGSNPYSTGSTIKNLGNGIVSGFVYDNSGKITNSYVNIELETKSAYIAGFVYNNNIGAVISESYAAATMNAGTLDSYAEQPFVGVDNKGNLLSYGELNNTYYLLTNYSVALTQDDKPQAKSLDLENFGNSNNLNGFVFILSNSTQERSECIWSYYDSNNKMQLLPILVGANNIAHSYRYVVKSETTESGTITSYSNAISYELGSKNNPYIITNVNQFNEAFMVYDAQYVRLINNINFGNDETAIQTKTKRLGESGYGNITSFEGNGLEISGIYFDVGESTIEKIGLFAEIENAFIKNLNLNFATPKTENQFSTTTVNYSGGLAGIITDSIIINISLNGASTTLTGKNFVGGLAGIIQGESLVYGINSNLSIKTTNANSNDIYYSYDYYRNYINIGATEQNYKNYLKNLSFAGGIAGVIDIEPRLNVDNNDSYNISFINIYGNEMAYKTKNSEQEANILASFAGGIAGYANQNTKSLKLKYFVGEKDLIRGDAAVGGIYGICLGKIEASQVTAEEDTQYEYDKTLGEYILNIDKEAALTTDRTKTGNLTLLESYQHTGGLVGIATGATINASYAKAGIKSGEIVGGLVGTSVASSITYSYAVPYVNVQNIINKNTENGVLIETYIGGLIGSAYRVQKNVNMTRNTKIRTFERLLFNLGMVEDGKSTDIQFAFSTLLVNKVELAEAVGTITNITDALYMDYLCADYNMQDGTNDYKEVLTSGGNTEKLTYVFTGLVDYGVKVLEDTDLVNFITNTSAVRGAYIELKTLYNLKSSDQIISFNNIFSSWNVVPYWALDNTRYFPLLLNDDAINYIKIVEDGDVEYIRANPNGNYKVVSPQIRVAAENNWIFEINFTGILTGEIEGLEKTPEIIIEGLVPDTSNETAGVFKQTTGATITNLNFVWNTSIDMNKVSNLTMVSGLSCLDEKSLINNVDVSMSKDESVSNIIETGNKFITGFGGIVGKSSDSNILDSTFNGSIDVLVKNPGGNPDGSNGDVFVGGVAANSNTNSSSDELMAIMNNAVGTNNEIETIFNIRTGECGNAYIGALAGKADNVAISGNIVGDLNADSVALNTELDEGNSYIGGLAGYAKNSATLNNNVASNISITGKTSLSSYVGGLFGMYQNISNLTNIKNSNAKSNIYLDETNIAVVNAGGAVGRVAGDVSITQCLFTGDVTNKAEDNKPTTSYVGGVVGSVADSCITLQETMSTIDIEFNSKNLYAGGLIGSVGLENENNPSLSSQAKANISYSASTGKIVPICEYGAVGGLIGNLFAKDDENNKTIIKSTYTVTSIVADAVEDNQIKNISTSALYGKYSGKVECDDSVIYSSDIALTPENNTTFGLNIAAETMWFTNIWHSKMCDSLGLWNNFKNTNTDARIPYIASLEATLIKYGILDKNDYIKGSSLRPEEIISTYEFINEDYTYFLLAKEGVALTGALNGILVGSDGINFNALELSNKTHEAVNYRGLIAVVNAGSAVSNIHLDLTDKTIDASQTTGLVAGYNMGVIYNCSVMGSNITLTGSYDIGLIAGINKGLVNYCYSTAEILTASSSVGGIVNTNAAKIANSYFTGYINSTQSSAGIVFNIDTGSIGYVYNCYMAGAITSFVENSFAGSSLLYGSQNYIDKLSNAEIGYIIEHDNGTVENPADDFNVLTSTSTYNLMSNNGSILKGNWYTTAVLDEDEHNILNTSSFAYGYNYNYPIYNFQKHSQSLGLLVSVELKYQTNTGYGYNPSLISVVDEEPTVEFISEEEYAYAFKVPHLGVLSSITGLLKNNPNLTYVLIYDILGNDIEWTALGTNDSTKEIGGFTASTGFSGKFVSNKNFKYDDSNERCLVTNLKTNGIFANISNAYIANIRLGNFVELNSSGALGTTVVGATTISDIYYEDGAIISGAERTRFGALLGEINITAEDDLTTEIKENALIINNLQTPTSNVLVLSGTNSVAGLIAGKIINGSIEFTGDNNVMNICFGGILYAGGLVGQIVGGSIIGNDNTINIVSHENEYVENLGGIASVVDSKDIIDDTTTPSGDVIITNVIINLVQSQILANNFGGIAANVNKEISAGNITISGTDSELELKGNTDTNRYFGLVAGKQTSKIELQNFAISNISDVQVNNESNPSFSESNSNEGVGVFIGHQEADLVVIMQTEIDNLKLKVVGIVNLGGVSGYYAGGSTYIENIGKFEIQGTTNVGGLYGWCAADINDTSFDGTYYLDDGEGNITEEIKTWELEDFATVVVDSQKDQIATNFGGLFGLLTGVINTESNKLVNHNSISVNGDKNNSGSSLAEEYTYYANNIGGVAGKFTGNTAKDLTNAADIELTTANYSDTESENLFSISNINDDGFVVRTANVGGIFGYVSGEVATTASEESELGIISCVNEGAISGYQNVGGIVGYVANGIVVKGQLNFGKDDVLVLKNNDKHVSAEDQPFIYKNAAESGNEVETKNTDSSGNIVGVISVGGIVGYAENNVEIINTNSTASVYGNASVGGVVGTANNITLKNNLVIRADIGEEGGAVTPTLVKGIYYLYTNAIMVSATQPEPSVFIPTSVGGLVGTSISSKISSNAIYGVNIQSSTEGSVINEDTTITGEVISTISNYMVNIGFGEGNTENLSFNSKAYNINNESKVKFEDITSGFGGFIGSIDSSTMFAKDELDTQFKIETNYIKDIKIDAQLGINVGTYYGYYTGGSSEVEEVTITNVMPILYSHGNIMVDGAYNIGGVIGCVDGEVKQFSNADLQGGAEVKLQSQHVGMYVGGLYGKVKSNSATDLNIKANQNVDIEINTIVSYYMGGLVGLLEITESNEFTGSVGTWIPDEHDTDGDGDTEELIYDTSETDGQVTSTAPSDSGKKSAMYFGGLVGMVKSTNSSGKITISVQGKHIYAFTVNTILNSNYFDGATQLDAQESTDQTNVTLLAQSYYVNRDSFNISATGDNTWYNESAKNPINTQTIGWAKEYTGFRVVSRFIPANQNGGEWDAIIPIYDAQYITAVGTVLNTDPEGKYKYEEVNEFGSIETIEKDFSSDPNKIIYTVYQTELGEAYMYTPIGIAKLAIFRNFHENEIELVNTKTDATANRYKYETYKAHTEKYYVDTCYLSTEDDGEWILRPVLSDHGKQFDLDGDDADDEGLLYGKDCKDLTVEQLMYFEWNKPDSNSGITDSKVVVFGHDFDDKHEIGTFGGNKDGKEEHVGYVGLEYAYYFKIKGYYYNGVQQDVLFDFQTIYANNTLTSVQVPYVKSTGGIGYKQLYNKSGALAELSPPLSGSVFSISGLNPKLSEDEVVYGNMKTKWEKFWEGAWKVVKTLVTIGAFAAAVFFTGGGAAAIVAAIKVTKAVAKVIQIAIIVVAWLSVASGLGVLISDKMSTIASSEQQLAQLYFSTKEQNLGLQTSAYTSEIYYENGKFVSQNDIGSMVVGDNGELYYYYSTIRPSDYYTNYWYVVPTLDCDDIANTDVVKENTGEKGIYEIDKTSLTAKGYDVIEKYFYKDGIYYYYPLAVQTGYYATQELSSGYIPDGLITETIDGKTYVAGNYNSANVEPYSPQDIDNNNIKYSDLSNITLNGYTINDSYKNTAEKNYIYMTDAEFSSLAGSYKEGYEYFETVYYTSDGANNFFGTTGLDNVRYATYTFTTDDLSSVNANYDYITRNYTLYKQSDTGDYYKHTDNKFYPISGNKYLVGEDEFNATDNSKRYIREIGIANFKLTSVSNEFSTGTFTDTLEGSLYGKTIIVELRPGALINPYELSVTGISESGGKFVSTDIASAGSSATITEDIPYFLYDGGYVTDLSLGGGKNGKATKVYTVVCDSSCRYNGEDVGSQEIPLYTASSEKPEYVLVSDLYNDIDSYANYYTVDVSEYGGDLLDNLDGYKVSSIYKKHTDGYLYKLNDFYFIGGSESGYPDTDDGLVYRIYTYNAAKTEDSFLYNKYLTNSKWRLYTTHKFTDKDGNTYNFEGYVFEIEKGETVEASYYLIPNKVSNKNKFTGRPNMPVTYFAENCKVTLGGGLTLTHTGINGKTVESGTITIE